MECFPFKRSTDVARASLSPKRTLYKIPRGFHQGKGGGGGVLTVMPEGAFPIQAESPYQRTIIAGTSKQEHQPVAPERLGVPHSPFPFTSPPPPTRHPADTSKEGMPVLSESF
ncbi:hypothetical protein HPB50_000930 [Hyalomma asiaticum]|uniref:Uncharacterized protein n=1 Tax=Hyalomma asiaticum TaxID=266040 RepID=A0ACB7RPL9_HYAAI|nr:hypothetical protein HPB50_000930 [Hyalomma asiaticum]